MNNQDLKSIINTACKYNDIEVLEKIASSKLIKTAGVRDLLQGLGLQMSQTANESQFKDKSALTSFIASSSTVNDREAASEIYEWWANKIKEIGPSTVNINIAVFGSLPATAFALTLPTEILNKKVVPLPTLLWHSISPDINSIMLLLMVKPKPKPLKPLFASIST